jgi:hypothetical protein
LLALCPQIAAALPRCPVSDRWVTCTDTDGDLDGDVSAGSAAGLRVRADSRQKRSNSTRAHGDTAGAHRLGAARTRRGQRPASSRGQRAPRVGLTAAKAGPASRTLFPAGCIPRGALASAAAPIDQQRRWPGAIGNVQEVDRSSRPSRNRIREERRKCVCEGSGPQPDRGAVRVEHQPPTAGAVWQEWKGSAFVRVRSNVRSRDEFRSTMVFEQTPAN